MPSTHKGALLLMQRTRTASVEREDLRMPARHQAERIGQYQGAIDGTADREALGRHAQVPSHRVRRRRVGA